MPTVEQIRRIKYEATTQGLDQAASKLDSLTRSHEGLAGASETSSRATLSMEKRLESIQRRFDENYRSQQQLAQVQRDLDKARSQGLVTIERQAQLLSLAETRLKAATKANDNFAQGTARGAKLSAQQVQNLGFQLNDIATSLASGASPFQVMAQQSGQVVQALSAGEGGLRGGLKGLVGLLGGMLTPATAIGAALVASAAAATYAWHQFSQQQKQLNLSLSGAGRGTNATSGQLSQIAETSAGAAQVSQAAAREMVASYASTGRIGTDIFSGLIKIQKDYAATTRQELPDATSELAKAFADPTKGAELLSERLGSLGDKTIQLIKRQQAQGDITGAQRTLLEAMNGTLVKHEDQLTAIGRAWETLKTAASDALDGIGKKLAPSLEEQAKQALEAYQAARQNVQELAKRPGYRVSQRDFARVEDAARTAMDADANARNEQIMREVQAQEAQARASATRIGNIVRDVMPEIERLDSLKAQAAELQRGLADPAVLDKLGVSADQAKNALERLNAQIASQQSWTERLRQDHALELQAIEARSVEERAAVEAEQARIAVWREGRTVLEQNAAAETARSRVMAEATRQAQDALRAANDNLTLVGLKPYQRALQETELRRRDNAERFGNEAAGQIYNLDRSGITREFSEGTLRDANEQLDQQIALLNRQAETMGLSTAAATEAAERQRLLNEYWRAGVPITAELSQGISDYARRAGEMAAAEERLADTRQMLDDINGLGKDTLGGYISDLRNGKSAAEAFANSLERVFDKVIDFVLSSLWTAKPGSGNPIEMLMGIFSGKSGGVSLPTAAPGGAMAPSEISGAVAPSITQAAAQAANSAAASVAEVTRYATTGLRSQVETYVREGALARGMDPDIIAKGINQESGFNPFALGDGGKSHGVMQLYTGGGLGNVAQKQGISLDPSNWQQQVDFGLDYMKQNGHGQWYGFRDSGVRDPWAGINRNGQQAFNGSAGNDNILGGMGSDMEMLSGDFDKLSQSMSSATPQITQGLTGLSNITQQGGDMVGSALQDTAGTIGQGADGIGQAINQLGQSLNSGGGSGGGFGNLLSMFGGGGNGGDMFSGGGSLDWGQYMDGVSFGFHSGGLVGRDHSFTRYIHPAHYNDAPRYHSGLRPDEVPAVLQQGEWVLSRDDVAAIKKGGAGSAGGVTVNNQVIDQSGRGVEVQSEARQNSDGSIDIVTVLSDKVKDDIRRGARRNDSFSREVGGGDFKGRG